MEIYELKEKDGVAEDVKVNRIYLQFKELLKELRKKELPQKIVESINHAIEELNSTERADNKLLKLLKRNQAKILELLDKELKIVEKGHYKGLWLVLGMSAFGIPIGIVLGLTILGDVSYFPVGFPFGIIIGIAIGHKMDKKALKEGRQLAVEIKY